MTDWVFSFLLQGCCWVAWCELQLWTLEILIIALQPIKEKIRTSKLTTKPQTNYYYIIIMPHASIYVFIYEGIKWLTDWLFNWLPDWLFDSLSTFTWLTGPNLRRSITWPISSRKYWIYAALKYFILKEHKTIKRGSEFQNSWQCNFTVAWITGK